ncbi:RNA-binding domain-containing protein [Hymenobacter endophyticus]|uniref:ATP-binding protein n=1 Tax=Hymenobacter endophyticus TaxID=3076335 RepID=A0ABU3TDW4_9BACT|nr:RNA-binding domain-containing protein [Hymenobacter endophyticus]MDU0369549.1 ATP-binding protein [Hymenobacter endophyticus]
MTEVQLQDYLATTYPRENERHEWKEYASLKHNFGGHAGEDLISYVAAFSNLEGGTLIIGIRDQGHVITGLQDPAGHTAENLPERLANKCPNLPTEGLRVEEFITSDSGKRVWVVHIPKHRPRRPVIAHGSKWQRLGDSLIALTAEREEAILREPLQQPEDWSRSICPEASLDDLDPAALMIARNNYKIKHPKLAAEVDEWDNATFLNKAKVCINGQITRAALLLLGREEAVHHLHLSPRITWILKNERGEELDYRHFNPPFLPAVDDLYLLIRNLRYRYIKDETLFPEEAEMYDRFVVREALHNCIAHQQYQGNTGRISVVEMPDQLVFLNAGPFLPGSVENVIQRDAPEPDGQNPFLAEAMVNLNMIDTIGSGIKRMFRLQREKYFPLPDYEIGNNLVKVTIIGRVLDMAYARVLARHPDLTLSEIMLLDKVQKHKPLTTGEVEHLRKRRLVEGRKDSLYISSGVAAKTSQNVTYLKNKGLGNAHYEGLIVTLVDSCQGVSRHDINELLWDQLPLQLSEEAKTKKIDQFINKLRRQDRIHNVGSRTQSCWVSGKAVSAALGPLPQKAGRLIEGEQESQGI